MYIHMHVFVSIYAHNIYARKYYKKLNDKAGWHHKAIFKIGLHSVK